MPLDLRRAKRGEESGSGALAPRERGSCFGEALVGLKQRRAAAVSGFPRWRPSLRNPDLPAFLGTTGPACFVAKS